MQVKTQAVMDGVKSKLETSNAPGSNGRSVEKAVGDSTERKSAASEMSADKGTVREIGTQLNSYESADSEDRRMATFCYLNSLRAVAMDMGAYRRELTY